MRSSGVRLALAFLLFLTPGLAEYPSLELTPCGEVDIPEISGLCPCTTRAGYFWTLSDSGNPPRVYAVNARGERAGPGVEVRGAVNVDWEAVTAANGRLYVGDLGNNRSNRPSLTIYELREPDPVRSDPAFVDRTYYLHFPDLTDKLEFDCEALFFLRGKLWVLTKHRTASGAPGTSTRLYRLDEDLVMVQERDGLDGFVTDAAISPDGKELAVLTLGRGIYATVWLFALPEQGDQLLSGQPRSVQLRNAGQCEAIAYLDRDTLLIGSEQKNLYQLQRSAFGIDRPGMATEGK